MKAAFSIARQNVGNLIAARRTRMMLTGLALKSSRRHQPLPIRERLTDRIHLVVMFGGWKSEQFGFEAGEPGGGRLSCSGRIPIAGKPSRLSSGISAVPVPASSERIAVGSSRRAWATALALRRGCSEASRPQARSRANCSASLDRRSRRNIFPAGLSGISFVTSRRSGNLKRAIPRFPRNVVNCSRVRV